jgi:hypothetical protein
MSDKTHPSQQPLFPSSSPAMNRTLPGLTPKRKRGSPGPDKLEKAGREHALDQLEKWRSGLVEIGREVAIQIARKRGRVTSVEVFATMRAQGYDDALDACDPRWMGAVFREEDVWQREGWETTGSHKRPVAIWSLRDPQNIPPSPREKVYRVIHAARDRGATVEEIVVATALKGDQVRNCIRDLERLDKVLATAIKRRPNRKRARKQIAYAVPEHHPDLV